jgi:hypothetical protein
MTADDFSDSFYYRPFAPTDERNSGRSDATLGPFLTLHQLAVPLLSLIVSRFDIAARTQNMTVNLAPSPLSPGTNSNIPPICFANARTIFIPRLLH